MYPTGRSDEFFYDGDRMIEDQGLVSSYLPGSGHTHDQYVWLGSLPVAMVKQRFTEEGVRRPSATDCTRNGEAAPCGTYFIVNDYLPKPIALVDSEGRLAGVGEYDAFGRVNTVSMRKDAPANARPARGAPFGTYAPFVGTIATFNVRLPPGASGRALVNYAVVNTTSGSHQTWVSASPSGPSNWGYAPTYSGKMGAVRTPWIPLANAPLFVRWSAPSGGGRDGYGGAVTASYEYRLHESAVATPVWLALRFPGQYADSESGLFGNWNRFYDPATGRYTASDPLMLSPAFLGDSLTNGKMALAYGYALNNPLSDSDSTGLAPDSLVRAWTLAMSNGQSVVATDPRAVAVVAVLLAACGTSEPCRKEVERQMSQPTADQQVLSALNEWLDGLAAQNGHASHREAVESDLEELFVAMGKGGKSNQADTGLQGLSDEEVKSAYDKAKGKERKRLEKELKVRGQKNKDKDRKTGGVK